MKSRANFPYKMLTIIVGFLVYINPLSLHADFCGEPVLQFGWYTTHQGKSQHIDIDGLIGDDFTVKKSCAQNFLVGLGYYFNCLECSQIRLQYGINAFYLAPTKINGNVTQENQFTNLSYHYTRTNYPIYLAAKALFSCTSCSNFVIDFGIGPNIIHTSGFKEKSLDGGITIPDAHLFAGKTVTAFSATAGIGWRIYNVLGNCSIEIGYRFFYLGEGELKKVNNQVRNTLHTGNSYANALIFTISI